MRRRLLVPVTLLIVAASCGGDGSDVAAGGSQGDASVVAVAFGADDGRCPSLTLSNDLDDEERARAGTACFLEVVEGGTPIVWDVSVPTVEGDPIYHRFDFTGDDVLLVVDDRADTFGSGSVRAQRCGSVAAAQGEWLPVGVDCAPTDHPGFVDAEPG